MYMWRGISEEADESKETKESNEAEDMYVMVSSLLPLLWHAPER